MGWRDTTSTGLAMGVVCGMEGGGAALTDKSPSADPAMNGVCVELR